MKKNGFTLIEVLVVLAIVGLLVVFLVPKLMGIQDRAKETAVKAVMHSVQLGVEAYNMENTVYPFATNISIRELCENYLMVGGYIAEVPKNPFTGKEYTDSDTAGKIIYNYDDSTGAYTLIGYKRDGTKKLLELSNM